MNAPAPAPRPTPAQLEQAKSIFTAAAAAAIAQRGPNVDFQTIADGAFKAAAVFAATERGERGAINYGGAL